MNIIKKHLTNGQYLTKKFEKTSLFLHHTVGLSAMSAWNWWNQTPQRVGTPYIIDRDGSIIECFDPKMWAYHLGIVGDDNYHEKCSVNIELVSAGKLYKVKEEFRFYPLWPQQTHYKVIPSEEVVTYSKSFRGHKYYHGYTEAQLESLKGLIIKILKDFPGIKFENSIDKMFTFDESIISEHKSGVFTHCSVRENKSDIIPYPAILETLKEIKESFKPGKSRSSSKKS